MVRFWAVRRKLMVKSTVHWRMTCIGIEAGTTRAFAHRLCVANARQVTFITTHTYIMRDLAAGVPPITCEGRIISSAAVAFTPSFWGGGHDIRIADSHLCHARGPRAVYRDAKTNPTPL